MEVHDFISGLAGLLQDETNPVTALANAAAYLYDETEGLNWAGFYLLHGDRAQTMENRSEREDVYIFRGFFRRSDLEEGKIGLCITRWDFGASDPENCIELANEEIRFDSGVNRIPLG